MAQVWNDFASSLFLAGMGPWHDWHGGCPLSVVTPIRPMFRRRSMLASPQEAPKVQVQDGRVVIEVNWDDADLLRDHFRRHGLSATVSLDPLTHEAALEVWEPHERVADALRNW